MAAAAAPTASAIAAVVMAVATAATASLAHEGTTRLVELAILLGPQQEALIVPVELPAAYAAEGVQLRFGRFSAVWICTALQICSRDGYGYPSSIGRGGRHLNCCALVCPPGSCLPPAGMSEKVASMCMHATTCETFCLSACLSACLPACLPASLPACLAVQPGCFAWLFCLAVLPVCLPVCLSSCLSSCQSSCLPGCSAWLS